jgi:hypothetical protein
MEYIRLTLDRDSGGFIENGNENSDFIIFPETLE